MNTEKITVRKLTFLVASGIFFFWILQNYRNVLGWLQWVGSLFTPILAGFCIAFVLNVPMRFLEKKIFRESKYKAWNALRRPFSIITSIIFIISVLTFLLVLVVPELLRAVGMLAQAIPYTVDKTISWVQTWSANNIETLPSIEQWLANLQINWAEIGKSALALATNGASSLLGGTFQIATGIAGGMTQLMFSFILALYMLLGKEKLICQIRCVLRAYATEKVVYKIEKVMKLSSKAFSNFIAGQCTEACILGTLCWIGMTLLSLPFAPTVSALVGFSALLPIVGGLIGLLIGIFMIATSSPISALWFALFLMTLQQIEGNVIYPRVVGSSVGLPGIWVLAGVTVGGALAGFVGMLFAVPVTSILYTLLKEDTKKRLKMKKITKKSFISQINEENII